MYGSRPFPNIPSDDKYNGPGSKQNDIPRVPSKNVFQSRKDEIIVKQEVEIDQLKEKIFKKNLLIEKLKKTNLALINQNQDLMIQNHDLMIQNNNLIEEMQKQFEKQNSIIHQQDSLIEQLKQFLPAQPLRPVARRHGGNWL